MVKTGTTSAAKRRRTSPKRSVAPPPHNDALSATAGAIRRPPQPQAIGAGRRSKSGKVTKVVRDSFTMPVFDYELIGALKSKCIDLGVAVKKSELLRAGLHALTRISDENLAQVIAAVESVKTGRPKGKKKKKQTNRAKGKKQ
jgi:hypothetical protein